jgi:REP element-mobilizing transposase RayT
MMNHNSEKHHRRSIRLKGYDYTQPGAYFVTICTHDRACLFGEVVDGQMRLNELGRLVEWTWQDLPNHVANIELDAFVVMPNHVHGIIVIVGAGSVGAGSEPAPTIATTQSIPANTTTIVTTQSAPTIVTAQSVPAKRYGLPEIVRQFKTFSARRINEHRQTPGASVWQRNYYEHIVRDEKSLDCIRQYIAENPSRWHLDRDNPQRHAGEHLDPFSELFCR